MEYKNKEVKFGDLKQGQGFMFNGAYYMKTNLIDISKKLSEIGDFCFCEAYNAVNLEKGYLCWFHNADCVDLVIFPLVMRERNRKKENNYVNKKN